MKDNAQTQQAKFSDKYVTADGQARAVVSLTRPQTLWFNTGTLCNITCANCYIESSPTNDALVYLTKADVTGFLDQLEERNWNVREIGVTGGEPFMNSEIIEILRAALDRGYDLLVLTNAMQPMMRPKIRDGLENLNRDFPDKMTLRVSLDHYEREIHDKERGKGSFDTTMKGMKWLRDSGIKIAVAGRVAFAESEASARSGYARLFATHGFAIDADNPAQTVLFPEMDIQAEVPEITTACWGILNKSPDEVMCASSRMVVKRKGATQPTVLACTLIAYDEAFEMGPTLELAEKDVFLNHPHCAKFCVLGGASCSA